MFARIARFEFQYQLRQPAFWVSLFFFFLAAFLATASDNVQLGSGGEVKANAPLALTIQLMIFSIVALFITATTVPGAVLRDTDTGMAGMVYATPVGRLPFLLGRFAGAYTAAAIAFLGAPLGMIVGIFMWWLDPETIGPFNLWHYLYPTLLFGLPNLLLTAAIFYAVAALTRRQMIVYGAMVTLLVGYLVTQTLVRGPELQELRAVLDPFGIASYGQVTRYWTPLERNTLLAPVEGYLLLNRLLWLGIGLLFVLLAVWRFRFETQPRKAGKSGGTGDVAPPPSAPVPLASMVDGVVPSATAGVAWGQLLRRTVFEARSVLRSPGLAIIGLLIAINMTANLLGQQQIYGTPLYPVTRSVSEIVGVNIGLLCFIVIIFYGGELVWRERQHRVHELVMASPTPAWVYVLSKLAALLVVVTCLLALAPLAGIIFQLLNGFTQIELGHYLIQTFVVLGLGVLTTCVLSLVVQSLVPNKFAGFAAMVGFLLLILVANRIGIVDNFILFGQAPGVPTSDMNGFGHFLEPYLWFNLYWGLASVVLMVLAHKMWPDAVPASFKSRLGRLRRGWTPVPAAIGLTAFIAMVGTGGWIAYNTHGLNTVVSSDEARDRQADFERTYGQYLGLPQPDIVDVKVDIDLYPQERKFVARGTYMLENRTATAVDKVHVAYSDDLDVVSQVLDGATAELEDRDYNYFIFALAVPMQPGERRSLAFETLYDNPGFENGTDITPVVYNGTFVNNFNATPQIGFPGGLRIQDRNERRKRDLPPIDRTAKLEDASRYGFNYLRDDSDFVTFETTVSTSPDQIAVAPGYLQREWEENGRRYFHYKMDAPILNFYSWLSADYAVKQDTWNGIDLAVYYHAPHNYNVDRMIDSTKKSLEYFSKNFGPYQHRQMRILEFPGYSTFAQAFPNTVPYSESFGFITDNRDPANIDYIFYVTAHEVAHQWWAHQVMGADVQGSTLLSETLSQYSALMVMEQEFGIHGVRRFLRWELDYYLSGRARETREELPLYRVENQPYVHYRKGAVAFYALKDYVGEAAVNRALARLVAETKFKSDPYPTSLDLIRLLREEAGPEHQDLITDLFQKIVLFDLRVEDHSIEALPDGKVKLRLDLHAEKFEVDAEGKETAVPLDMAIDIGVFTKDPSKPDFGDGDIAHFQKHRITEKNPTIELVVDAADTLWFGLDPYHKLIDRRTNDNLDSADGRPSGGPQASGGAGGSTSR